MGAPEKIHRCVNCHREIIGWNHEWAYKLGKYMYFCTYSCMREKQAEMDKRRSETQKIKAALKAAKKKEEQERMETETLSAVEQQPDERVAVEDELHAMPAPGLVMFRLGAAEADYLSRMLEARLMEIVPDGYGLNWLIDMVNLLQKMRNR